MRVLYVGMLNRFSLPPLQALLEAGVEVIGLLISEPVAPDGPPIRPLSPPPTPDSLPVLSENPIQSVVDLARQRQVPAFGVSQPSAPETLDVVRDLQPDVACVACFAYRLPPSLLALPPHGFLNVHPSLLPAYRGPTPLFWVFRDGLTETGVTIHLMDADFDTGDVLAQARLPLPDGILGAEADARAAELGGSLLVEVLRSVQRGDLTRTRQSRDAGFHRPAPSPADFTLDVSWPARRAFNFMRGTAEWGREYPVQTGSQRLALQSAIAVDANGSLDTPFQRRGTDVLIQFTPGILHARPA